MNAGSSQQYIRFALWETLEVERISIKPDTKLRDVRKDLSHKFQQQLTRFVLYYFPDSGGLWETSRAKISCSEDLIGHVNTHLLQVQTSNALNEITPVVGNALEDRILFFVQADNLIMDSVVGNENWQSPAMKLFIGQNHPNLARQQRNATSPPQANTNEGLESHFQNLGNVEEGSDSMADETRNNSVACTSRSNGRTVNLYINNNSNTARGGRGYYPAGDGRKDDDRQLHCPSHPPLHVVSSSVNEIPSMRLSSQRLSPQQIVSFRRKEASSSTAANTNTEPDVKDRVLQRDAYACVFCYDTVALAAVPLLNWDEVFAPEHMSQLGITSWADVRNSITLCGQCREHFLKHLLAINPEDNSILVSACLTESSNSNNGDACVLWRSLAGRSVVLPKDLNSWPSKQLLTHRLHNIPVTCDLSPLYVPVTPRQAGIQCGCLPPFTRSFSSVMKFNKPSYMVHPSEQSDY